MSLESDLTAYIETQAGVTALLGSASAMRFYPTPLRQNPMYPSVTFQRINTPRYNSLSGSSHLAIARLQLDIWASSVSSALQVRTALQAALMCFRGAWGTTSVYGAFFDDEIDQPEPITSVAQKIITLSIWHSEP